MRTFDEYQDGDWVTYVNPKHNWHLKQFQAYKSKYTHNAFRLKYGSREVVADISEIQPISETNKLVKGFNENFNRDFQSDFDGGRYSEEEEYQD